MTHQDAAGVGFSVDIAVCISKVGRGGVKMMGSWTGYFLAILTLTIAVSAQDWQHCKPAGSYSFLEVKDRVRSVTISHIIEGWDVKAFNRSGDLVPLAIVQTLTDAEMTSPKTLEEVLLILREAYACSSRCVALSSDRQPRIGLLLLEHLHNITTGKLQADIEDTAEFLRRQRHPE